MPSLKIRTLKGNEIDPDTTVTIPLGVLKVSSKLMPKQAEAGLQEKGIDLNQIFELSYNKVLQGTLVEIEEHMVSMHYSCSGDPAEKNRYV